MSIVESFANRSCARQSSISIESDKLKDVSFDESVWSRLLRSLSCSSCIMLSKASEAEENKFPVVGQDNASRDIRGSETDLTPPPVHGSIPGAGVFMSGRYDSVDGSGWGLHDTLVLFDE
mmetsp:Transcript_85945/g.128744  ORF Transcript_85945/g.128744 Transcript_85945/m.128744 type:complete len:120 (-) Transcript_85945:143-502(-)